MLKSVPFLASGVAVILNTQQLLGILGGKKEEFSALGYL